MALDLARSSPRLAKSLVDRQQEYARPATSTLGAVAGSGWSSLSVDKERGSFITAAIKRGMEKPTTLLNPSHIDPNPKALRFDDVKRYETSEIGMGQKRSSEIKFHCRPRIELGTKDSQKTRFITDDRKSYFQKAFENGMQVPASNQYDNFWRRLVSMHADNNFQAFTDLQVPGFIDKVLQRAKDIPGPGTYNLKDPNQRAGLFNKSKKPMTDIDWAVFHSKQIPSAQDYVLPSMPLPGGGKISNTKRSTYLTEAVRKGEKEPGPADENALFENDPRLALPKGGVISSSNLNTWLDQRLLDGRRLPGSADYDNAKSTLLKTGAVAWNSADTTRKSHCRDLSELNQYIKVKDKIPGPADYIFEPVSFPRKNARKQAIIGTGKRVLMHDVDNSKFSRSIDRYAEDPSFRPHPAALIAYQRSSTAALERRRHVPEKNQPHPLRQIPTARTTNSHRQPLYMDTIDPSSPSVFSYKNVDALYQSKSSPFLGKALSCFDEIAKQKEGQPGPGSYDLSKSGLVHDIERRLGGGFSKSFKNLDDMRAEKEKMALQEVEEMKKQEQAKKKGAQKKPKKKASLGIKILKNTVTTPTFSVTIKSDCCPPFCICMSKDKRLLTLESKVRKKMAPLHKMLGLDQEEYCLVTTSNIPLIHLQNRMAVKYRVPMEKLNVEKDLCITKDQVLRWVPTSQALLGDRHKAERRKRLMTKKIPPSGSLRLRETFSVNVVGSLMEKPG